LATVNSTGQNRSGDWRRIGRREEGALPRVVAHCRDLKLTTQVYSTFELAVIAAVLYKMEARTHDTRGGIGPNPSLGPLNRVNGLVVLGLLATVVYSIEKTAQRLGPWP